MHVFGFKTVFEIQLLWNNWNVLVLKSHFLMQPMAVSSSSNSFRHSDSVLRNEKLWFTSVLAHSGLCHSKPDQLVALNQKRAKGDKAWLGASWFLTQTSFSVHRMFAFPEKKKHSHGKAAPMTSSPKWSSSNQRWKWKQTFFFTTCAFVQRLKSLFHCSHLCQT